MATNAVGTSQVVLSLRTLRNIEITLPLKEEQVAIGDLMRKLDIYITLHQQEPFLCGNSVNGGVELC